MLIASTIIFFISSCKDDSITDMGSSIQPPGDKITVASNRFDIHSENYPVDFMYSRPDSFLLGTFYDPTYGTVHADIMAQVEYPKDFVYPVDAQPDSVLLVMYYRKFFGDAYSPMHLSVYEMNKQTFNYTTPYPSNINPEDYVDKSNSSLLIGEKTFTATDAASNVAAPFVITKLKDEFVQKFSNINADTYKSDSAFFDFFKGMYITTDFGSASMLYVQQIDLEYYHSTTRTLKDIHGQDSIVRQSHSITFPANTWVRQVNRFMHPDKTSIINQLESSTEQIHHISSPANMYTRIKMPIKHMSDIINTGDAKVLFNNAKLRVDIDHLNDEAFPLPMPNNLLLIKEQSVERFFTKNELPTDTVAILGTYQSETDTDGEKNYFYNFNIANLVANEFKQEKLRQTMPDSINFLLVPVRLKLSPNNMVTEVSQQFLLYGVTICGGEHSERPIKADIIYSKF